MPLTPLEPGTRVGPESEPQHFRVARPRRLGEIVIEYEVQDMVRGDSCILLEFAPSALCIRGAGGLVVPDSDTTAVWQKALAEFIDRSTATQLAENRHIQDLRAVWLGRGTGFWAVKTAPNSPVIQYESDIVLGTRPRRASQSSSTGRYASRPIKPVAEAGVQSRSRPIRPVGADPSASRSRPIRPVGADPSASRSRPNRPVGADPSASRSRPIRPVGTGPSTSRSRPIRPVGADPSASRSRPVRPVGTGPSTSRSRPIRPVGVDPSALRSRPIRLVDEPGPAGQPKREHTPSMKIANSPTMDSLQAELMAMVKTKEGTGDGVHAAGTRRGAGRTPSSPLMRALGINEENRMRIAVLVSIALALVVALQVCGTG